MMGEGIRKFAIIATTPLMEVTFVVASLTARATIKVTPTGYFKYF